MPIFPVCPGVFLNSTIGGRRHHPVNVVKLHAVAFDELADRRVSAFREFGKQDVPDHEDNQSDEYDY
jgi:hypothetical protein